MTNVMIKDINMKTLLTTINPFNRKPKFTSKTDHIKWLLKNGKSVSQLSLQKECSHNPWLYTTRLGGIIFSLREQNWGNIKTREVKTVNKYTGKKQSYAEYYI